MNKAGTPLFLLGAMRSGTTYLRNVLSANPQVLSLGSELNRFWTAHGVPCGAVPTCPPMSDKDLDTEHATQVKKYFKARNRRRNFPFQLIYRCYRKLRFSNETILKGGDPFYLLNKSTHLLNKVALIDALFPHAKYVYIIRDVYSQSNSLAKHFTAERTRSRFHISYPKEEGHCWSYVEADEENIPNPHWQFADLPRFWLDINSFALKRLNQLAADRLLVVGYQSIVESLPETLNRIGKFLNLANINKNVATQLINNQTASPLTQWRQELSDEQVSCIDQTLSEHLEQYQPIKSAMENTHA